MSRSKNPVLCECRMDTQKAYGDTPPIPVASKRYALLQSFRVIKTEKQNEKRLKIGAWNGVYRERRASSQHSSATLWHSRFGCV